MLNFYTVHWAPINLDESSLSCFLHRSIIFLQASPFSMMTVPEFQIFLLFSSNRYVNKSNFAPFDHLPSPSVLPISSNRWPIVVFMVLFVLGVVFCNLITTIVDRRAYAWWNEKESVSSLYLRDDSPAILKFPSFSNKKTFFVCFWFGWCRWTLRWS